MFVIFSASEAGFWSNKIGWVYDASDATRFTAPERETLSLPLSAKNDARWLPSEDKE